MTKIILVRHGQASAGTHDYDRLSKIGMQQAELLGQAWKNHGFSAASAFSGSLKRQKHTAELALGHSEHNIGCGVLEALNEYDHNVIDKLFGNGSQSDMPENLTFADYTGIMQRWRDADDTTLQQAGAESWQTFSERGWHAVQNAAQQHDNSGPLVFFTSGGVISTILQQVIELDFHRTLEAIWDIRNASATTLTFDGSRARLIDFNTVSHLDSQYDKQLITQI